MAAIMENHVIGRPPKFPTAESLEVRVNRYFNSISHKEKLVNDDGEALYDINGELMVKVTYVSPPSILGMCLFLGLSRETLLEYTNKADFSDTIKEAKAKVEQYLADQLSRTTQVAGIIFNLKNNFGWKDVQIVEQTGPNGGPLLIQAVNAYSDDDLKAMEEIMARSQISGEVVDI